MNMVDLHIHSTSSDGIFKPAELVAIARAAGISAIAIADHDSIDGINEALAAAAAAGITLIPSVELSVAYGKYHDVHILGYFIDQNDRQFNEKLLLFRERRETRGLQVIANINQKLQSEGKPTLASSEILARAEGSLGRPHIARALIDKGLAASMQDAFNAYLVPCNVPKEYFPFADALAEIHRMGGVAVLAHPQSISRDKSELSAIISDMAAKGLDGVEAFNSMGVEGEDSFLKKTAQALGLVVTGGSDFHGGEEGFDMGRGRGNLYLTEDLLQGIRDVYAANRTSPAGYRRAC
jgi:predicted metal-dependent phosphoesterase TrpH